MLDILRMGVVSFWMDRHVAPEQRVALRTNPPIEESDKVPLTLYGKCRFTA